MKRRHASLLADDSDSDVSDDRSDIDYRILLCHHILNALYI